MIPPDVTKDSIEKEHDVIHLATNYRAKFPIINENISMMETTKAEGFLARVFT